jgi:hypothetical protein
MVMISATMNDRKRGALRSKSNFSRMHADMAAAKNQHYKTGRSHLDDPGADL